MVRLEAIVRDKSYAAWYTESSIFREDEFEWIILG